MSKPHGSSERGQALILIVFGMLALFGIVGLAIDGGSTYADRRRAQNAADTAALAGALARINGESWVNTTLQVARLNGYSNDGKSNFVEIHSPPISGTYAGNIEYIQVRITSIVRTPFAAVVGRPQLTNVVEAVARSKPSQYRPMFGGAAVVSLAATSDCDQHKAFWIHAEQTLSISGSGVFVNSSNRNCALIQQGNGSIRIDDGSPIQVVGGYSMQKARLFTPFPPIDAIQVSYPPPFFMPDVACHGKEGLLSADGTTASSGSWGGIFPPPGVSVLGSGVFCIEGDLVLTTGQGLMGSNVVIYMERGQLRIGSGVSLDLKAPDSGKYAGLLVYQPAENKNPLILNAGPDSAVTGSILAPGAEIRIKGNDSAYGFHSQLLGYTINADGDSNVIIKYFDEQNYDALYYPEVQLAQ